MWGYFLEPGHLEDLEGIRKNTRLLGWQTNEAVSESCPVTGFNISDIGFSVRLTENQ
jgi:hypothetical protein